MPTYIKHLSHYHPNGIITNAQFEKSLNTTSDWIIEKTGIRERRILNDYEGSFPGLELAKRALIHILDRKDFQAENTGMIISASTHDDIHYPNAGNTIAEELGLDIPVFQLKVACSSVAYAIYLSSAILPTLDGKDVLVVTGEAFTRYVDYGDRSSCILFGDAGTAVVISRDPGIFEIVDIEVGGKGMQLVHSNRTSETSHISASEMISGELSLGKPRLNRRKDSDRKFYQDGKGVVKFVLTEIPIKIRSLLNKNSLSVEDLDFVISHQSNLVMMNNLWVEVGVPVRKHLYNVDLFGNTSSAGWVTVLSQRKSDIEPGSLVLVSIFGAGMTWANILLKKTE